MVAAVAGHGLVTTECDVAHHNESPLQDYLLGDIANCFDALAVYDRFRSELHFNVSSHAEHGARLWIDAPTWNPVCFREDVVGDADIFSVAHFGRSLAVVSDRIANLIFDAQLHGVSLRDVARERAPPDIYDPNSASAWRDLYPC